MVSPLFQKRVYVDTSALIYALETPQAYPGLQTKFLDLLVRKELFLVTSWITFAEALVRPLATQDKAAETGYRGFFVPSTHFEVLPVDQSASDQAAKLRALHGLRLPDALHSATGMTAGCTHFLTGDAKWKIAGLNVILATDL